MLIFTLVLSLELCLVHVHPSSCWRNFISDLISVCGGREGGGKKGCWEGPRLGMQEGLPLSRAALQAWGHASQSTGELWSLRKF